MKVSFDFDGTLSLDMYISYKIYTDGDGVRSSNTQLSAKSEAHLSLANG
jgi:hypothetical protein